MTVSITQWANKHVGTVSFSALRSLVTHLCAASSYPPCTQTGFVNEVNQCCNLTLLCTLFPSKQGSSLTEKARGQLVFCLKMCVRVSVEKNRVT